MVNTGSIPVREQLFTLFNSILNRKHFLFFRICFLTGEWTVEKGILPNHVNHVEYVQ